MDDVNAAWRPATAIAEGTTAPLTAVFRKISQRWRDHREAYVHAIAGRIAFRSGLGDSSDLLYGLVRSMKPEVCVEIGSARGRSAASIGLALKKNGRGRLYAIDPHCKTEWNDDGSVDSFTHISRNLARLRLQDQVEIVRKTSEDSAAGWSRTIDMIFIDGDHSFAGVKRDWDLFIPHLRPFGVAIFHDTLWDIRPDPRWQRADMGVPAFVESLRQDGYPVITIDRDFGVSMVQPVKGGVVLSPGSSSFSRPGI